MHIHQWQRTHDLMLALSDAAGWYDRLLIWVCTPCGQWSVVTGSFSLHSGPVNLPDLETRAA